MQDILCDRLSLNGHGLKKKYGVNQIPKSIFNRHKPSGDVDQQRVEKEKKGFFAQP